ncbi:tryptophan--tRNA ligase [Acidobacteria bacterium AH-259-A15]|nr:tryptophan--tRNA ligase [Acidobacteria bacterium AH-259-A15]
MKKRVFSGMRPTGRLHLGNFVGALENWVRLQDEYDCIYGIVDYHALTSEYRDVDKVGQSVLDVAIDWLASGIDPQKSTILVQSLVPEHAELHLLLSMIVPVPWLERVPTYKEQIQQLRDKDLSTYGFLGYPVLQAADILIYKADTVPVGEDQVAHIELCREIARRFNHFYGPVFPEPEAKLTKAARLPGTDGRKMSKSYGNEIQLSEDPKSIRQKVMTMVTDPARVRRTDPGNPEVCPVFDYHKVFTDAAGRQWAARGCRTAGIGCIDCKNLLLKNMLPVIEPLYDKRVRMEKTPDRVRDLLMEGSRKARGMAKKTLQEVRQAMKIDY